MARIKLGTTVVGIRGTVAGLTFSAGQGGPYVRPWVIGGNPRTPAQQQQRSFVARLAADWRALTSSERSAWRTWAALPAQDLTNSLGETYSASGFNWFVTVNTRLQQIGRSIRSAPPTASRPAAPSITSLTVPASGGATPSCTYPSGEFSGFDLVAFGYVMPSTSAATAPARSFRLVEQAQSPIGSTSENLAGWEDAFGLLRVSQRAFTLIHRQTSDGLRSASTPINTEVT